MTTLTEVRVPDIGDFEGVEVIEILVATGDTVKAEDSLISLESDKATMEVPSPGDGVVKEIKISVGQRVSEGDIILTLEAATAEAKEQSSERPAAESKPSNRDATQADADQAASKPSPTPKPAEPQQPTRSAAPAADKGGPSSSGGLAHASPSIRRFARELGVPLDQVGGSGRKGRITREDIQAFVKQRMQGAGAGGGGGLSLLPWPQVDFAQFGPVESQALSRINKITGANLARNWAMIPHVTQHEQADITEMEAFRREHADKAKEQGFKLTPLAFLIKAVVVALKAFPRFNASLDVGGENLILKQYFNIGVAVDTPDGLVVPVIRDCQHKSLFELAQEVVEISVKARDKKLSPSDLQGGCFSISSLGGIGGSAFTPIINAPEVAILGVSRATQQPFWDGQQFVPRLLMPLSLSYDHRVIDGAAGARFITYLAHLLADLRRLLL